MKSTNEQGSDILIVEDSAADRKLLERLFKGCLLKHRLYYARDGEEAADFIFQRNQFTEVPRPDLVLLDLNMPKRDGRDFLAEVKAHPVLKCTPIVVLTTSSNDIDVSRSYASHANSYIQKPHDLESFQAVIKLIEQYWLTTVELPRASSSGGLKVNR